MIQIPIAAHRHHQKHLLHFFLNLDIQVGGWNILAGGVRGYLQALKTHDFLKKLNGVGTKYV